MPIDYSRRITNPLQAGQQQAVPPEEDQDGVPGFMRQQGGFRRFNAQPASNVPGFMQPNGSNGPNDSGQWMGSTFSPGEQQISPYVQPAGGPPQNPNISSNFRVAPGNVPPMFQPGANLSPQSGVIGAGPPSDVTTSGPPMPPPNPLPQRQDVTSWQGVAGSGMYTPTQFQGGVPLRAANGQVYGYQQQGSTQPDWQDTPIGVGMPSYNQLFQNMGGYQGIDGTHQNRLMAMQMYNQMLGTGNQMGIPLGQLGVEQGRLGVQQGQLGLQASQAYGINGIPGSIHNDAARSYWAGQQMQDALSHSTRADTVASSILQSMMGQGQTVTPQMAQQIRQTVGGTLTSGLGAPTPGGPGPGGAPPAPGGQPPWLQGGTSGTPFAPQLPPGASPFTANQGNGGATGTTGNVANSSSLENSWAELVNGPLGVGGGAGGGTRQIPAERMEQAITQFFSNNPPNSQNVNALRAFLLSKNIPEDVLNRWLTARGATGTHGQQIHNVMDAQNAISPGHIGGSSFNNQTPLWLRGLRLTPPGMLGTIGRGLYDQLNR